MLEHASREGDCLTAGGKAADPGLPRLYVIMSFIRQSVTGETYRVRAGLLEAAEALNFDEVESEGRGFDGQTGEAVMRGEGFRRRGNGMNDDEPRGYLARGVQGAPHRIGEQRPSQTLPLPFTVDGQPPQRDRRICLGMLRRMTPVTSCARLCPTLRAK